MEREDGTYVIEWRIDNLSQWCAEVHGNYIQSPEIPIPCSFIELYPKGISGQGKHLVVRLRGIELVPFSCELSFYCSDGSLHCSKQQVNAGPKEVDLELSPGLKFEDVLSRISGDFIILGLRRLSPCFLDRRVRTTINVLKMSLKMDSGGIEEMKANETKELFFINFTPNNYWDRLELNACSGNDVIDFLITPPTEFEYPFAVEMSVSLTRRDGTVDSCVKKEHVFRDDSTSWTFPYPWEKKELVGKGISLFLCLKTKNVIQSPFFVNWDYRYIIIETNNTPLSDEALSMNHNKVEALTKDSESQTSLPSGMPDDSVLVLSKELMCLYQDQKFSNIDLKCDNVTFPVHKNILSARSPVLDRLLSLDMKESASGEVVIGDLDPSTLSRFLTYLYTGAIEEELQSEIALKLYYAADKYEVPSLKMNCSKFLRSNVSISNVCDILSLADRHQDVELTAVSLDFILDNYNTVLKSKEWDTLTKNEPLLVAKTLTGFFVEGRVKKDQPH